MNHRSTNAHFPNHRSTGDRVAGRHSGAAARYIRRASAASRPRRHGRRLTLTLLVSTLALGVLLVGPSPFSSSTGTQSASAWSDGWWEAWFAERGSDDPVSRAERREARAALGEAREARRAELATARAARVAERDARRADRAGRGSGTADSGTAGADTVVEAASAARPAAVPGSSAGSSDGILLSRAELMALPTSGPGWDAIMDRIAEPYGGSYTLGTRDESNKDVLAHALAGARLDHAGYKGFARDKIEHMMNAPRNTGDVLGTLRHLQTYVISADLIDLASFDPALDARFRPWLAQEIRAEYTGGGGGGSVISTHEKKPNNFGTHAGATRIAAALYLGDDAELQAARDVWYGWATGDPAYEPATRVWTGTSWQCGGGWNYGINPQGCSRDGVNLDGVIPEDQERCGEFSRALCDTNYVHGATDGMTLSFWMLARQGEDPWAWGDRAALRQMQWKYAAGQAPYSGFRWQIPVIEDAYGIDLPGNAPTMTSTNVGFADWWAQ